MKLSDNDRKELDLFGAYLHDANTMPRRELYIKHAEYLGLTESDVARLKANDTPPPRPRNMQDE